MTVQDQIAAQVDRVSKAIDAINRPEVKPVELAKLVGVREQMVYNYINAKRIKAHHNQGGYWRVTKSDAKAWAAGYFTRKIGKDS